MMFSTPYLHFSLLKYVFTIIGEFLVDRWNFGKDSLSMWGESSVRSGMEGKMKSQSNIDNLNRNTQKLEIKHS